MVTRILACLLVTGLAGCSSMPFELVDNSQTMQASTSLGNSIPPSQSMAALPLAAGTVVSVIERQRGNALQHEVTLHGAPPNYGENQIIVTAYRNDAKATDDLVPTSRPNADDINNEMSEKIPGGPLPISNNAPQNGAGTFAYAFGRKGSVSCLYAWQWVDQTTRMVTAPVSVRIRLCKPGATEEVLVDYVRQLYLMPRNQPGASSPAMAYGGGGMRPYGDALSATSRGGGQPYAMYQTHPYGMGYGAPMAQAERPAQKVVVKKVIIRRIVRRQVVAPQIYSYAPPVPAPAVAAPVVSAAPLPQVTPRATGGYSAVPMPQ